MQPASCAFVTVLIGWAAAAAAEETCVVNGSEHRHLFAAEADDVRVVEWLDPGGRLCVTAEAAKRGVVSVYETFDALEGCSRLVTPGGSDTLLQYVDFDRCHWASNQ